MDLNIRIAVIGLGYVGLPLLCCFARHYECCGFDINSKRIEELSKCIDSKKCVEDALLDNLTNVRLTTNWEDLSPCNYIIVCAPTPIDQNNQPDLSALKSICQNLGKIITNGACIIFESTVAPGTTDEICTTILERESGLKINEGFFVGYSPERINIGDSLHSINIVPKLVAGSNADTLYVLKHLYETGIGCPVVSASSIKIAEAAKLYENVQRDVLIALANQYSEYCHLEGIDIKEVTECASTKWNFAKVLPGLVGGHCIGVDPYYLIDRAKMIKTSLSLVELSRTVNEGIPNKITGKLVSLCIEYNSSGIIILGASYKPNTGDTRNSKAINIINSLCEHKIEIELFDPLCDSVTLKELCPNASIKSSLSDCTYDVVAVLVNHDIFWDLDIPNYRYVTFISEML